MSNENKVRLAHELLDEVNAREDLTPRQVGVLRSFLPERPKQKTLAEITSDVYIAWYDTIGSDWDKELYGDLDAWLRELHEQLKGLIDAQPTAPALPAGMRLADHEAYGRVVVSPRTNDIGQYKIFHLDDSYVSGAGASYVEADALTFIDAEPALKPPFQAEPAHPEFLETEADYENAPEGTIVARDSINPWVKEESVWVQGSAADATVYTVPYLKGPRRVLRWGNK